jgi:hypothetical protein
MRRTGSDSIGKSDEEGCNALSLLIISNRLLYR